MALTEKQITDAVTAKHKGREVESVVINPDRVAVYLTAKEKGGAPERVVHRVADLKAPRGTKTADAPPETPEA